jgi:uncharacterized protein
MKNTFSYFKWSFVFTLIGMFAGYCIAGINGAIITGVLGILEVSLSFDNAVINAKKLTTMDPTWRRRYLVWGMAISVGFMRLLFPLLIVAVIAKVSPWAAATLAINSPKEYASILTSAHHEVAAFGGAFLMMVFLKYFVDQHKDEHWFHVIEAPLTRMGKLEGMEIALTLGALLVSSSFMHDTKHQAEFLFAGACGVVLYLLVGGFSSLFDEEEGSGSANTAAAKSGLATFLYLEVQDASFSFDGVIGAFALSNNLFIITIGLAIGALFVRSFTLMLVDKGTLAAYRYLEHGAFWAVGTLATIMMVSVHVEIPEAVTGLIGAGLIVAALVSSIRANKREALVTA